MAEEDESSGDHGPLGDPADAPSVKNYDGRWDEVISAIILVAPWIVLIVVGLYVVFTGSVSTNVAITGEIPVFWLAVGAGVLLGVTYVLAMTKFFGVAPVAWLGNKIHNAAKNYNPEE